MFFTVLSFVVFLECTCVRIHFHLLPTHVPACILSQRKYTIIMLVVFNTSSKHRINRRITESFFMVIPIFLQ